MSTTQESDDSPAVPEPLRTVTAPFTGKENAQMNAIGWVLAFGLLMVMLPLLPILLPIWLAGKLGDSDR